MNNWANSGNNFGQHTTTGTLESESSEAADSENVQVAGQYGQREGQRLPRKTSNPEPKQQFKSNPKITPEEYNPNGVNNLPGKGVKPSPNVPKWQRLLGPGLKLFKGIFEGTPLLITPVPGLIQNPGILFHNPDLFIIDKFGNISLVA